MHTLKTTKIVSAVFISLVLSACGGGASSPLDPKGSSSSLSSGAVDTTSPKAIGYGFDSSFTKGQIGVSIGDAALSPGGSTNLTVNIVSSTNTLAATPVQITFNSPCIASGEAKLTVGTTTTNVVTSSFGEATIKYTANGCSGADQVTATAVIDNKQEVARTTLNISPDTILAITPIDPVVDQISLKGTGGQETAVISFTVTGITGAPIKNVLVDFSLSAQGGGASLGGLALVNSEALSDKNGMVSTTVQAGNVATSVVVTAKTRSGNIATQSKKLIVSTGIPDQDSFTLGANDHYPMAWNHNDIQSTFTVQLADAFNNPVSDGTAISFTTEGGAIDDACTTLKGKCSVVWRSQNPRPIRNSSNNSVDRLLCVNAGGLTFVADYANCTKERAGRVTVLAHAIGNESFIDANGNGLYDFGADVFKTHEDYPSGNIECDKNAPLASSQKLSNSPQLPCDDLVEAYLDRDESGTHDNDEPFVDANLDVNYSYENGIYNGILCRDGDAKCTKEKVTIRQESILIMVSDGMLMGTSGFPYLANTVSLDARPNSTSSSSSASSSVAGTYTATAFFWVADQNGNGAPGKTTLKLDTSSLKNATAKLTTEGPLANSQDPTYVEVRFFSDDSGNKPTGFVQVLVTFPTPTGDITYSDFINVN
ncbi:hypothetical protein D0C16_14510 [Cellvibrio sp. KY-GH-1]|uniref:hypothetical protein n=1 Tax=Cellvibrio sp. KY-GH-1 TaxID=2303332 RepID=UPI001245C89E|nr:hypothetical protein [Cellvibrio sp. KY-GH-1]QEY17083.1 hypothetical protein D0C16_14510 [Cellvibrio sp. KY-GH-1]